MRLLSYVDIVLWCVRPQDARAAVALLEGLVKSVPGWRDKIRIVWLLERNEPIAPYVPELYQLAERHFKLAFDAPGANQNTLLQHGFERIVHHLRGIQIGSALGGGAARGMAHLGVLKALERHGIYIDMLSGTSAGAMVGAFYAGLDPDYILVASRPNYSHRGSFDSCPAPATGICSTSTDGANSIPCCGDTWISQNGAIDTSDVYNFRRSRPSRSSRARG